MIYNGAQAQDTRDFGQERAAHMAKAYEDFNYLETQCAERGVYAVQDDLHMIRASTQAGKPTPVSGQLNKLLEVLQHEAQALERWDRAARPAFFAQQVFYRAKQLGAVALTDQAHSRLMALGASWLEQHWCAGPGPATPDRVLSGSAGWVRALQIRPDGRQAVSGGRDGTFAIWDLDAGRLKTKAEATVPGGYSVAITPDGTQAVVGCEDGRVAVLEIGTNQVKRIWQAHDGWVLAVAIAPDGRWAASGSHHYEIKVWCLEENVRLEYTLRGHRKAVTALAITPDEGRLISGSHDHTVKVWNLNTGRLERTWRGHKEWVDVLAVTPDGQRVVSSSSDGTVRVWNLRTGRCEYTLHAREQAVGSTTIALLSDGRGVLSSPYEGPLRIWDLRTGDVEWERKGFATTMEAVAISQDGRQIIGSQGGPLRVWNIARGPALRKRVGHAGTVRAIAFTPNGQLVISGSYDGTLKVWNVLSGQMEHMLTVDEEPIEAVVTLPSQQAVSCNRQGDLVVWDLDHGTVVRALGRHPHAKRLAATPDGHRLVSYGSTGQLKVWDLTTGQPEGTLGSDDLPSVQHIAITEDGRWVVTSGGRKISAWHLRSRSQIEFSERAPAWPFETYGENEYFWGVTVTDDGRAIFGCADGTLRVWDLARGKQTEIWKGLGPTTGFMMWTTDGRLFACRYSNGGISLWDMISGEEIAAIHLEAGIECAAIAPDGMMIMAGDRDGNVYCLKRFTGRSLR